MQLRFFFFTILISTALNAAQFPPEVEAERYLREAERLLQEKSYNKASKEVSKAASLPIKQPDKYYFILGTIKARTGQVDEALGNLVLFLNMAEQSSPYYQQALDTILKIEGSAAAGFTKPSTEKLRGLSPATPKSYVKQMTSKIVLPDQTESLQHYVNSLLKANAIQVKTMAKNVPETYYKVHFNTEGRLIITRNKKDQFGLKSNVDSLSVYGISTQLGHACSWQEQRCWVTYPQNNEGKKGRWLEISYAPHAIGELVDGMGLLIRELQK